ncbi:MAG: FAD-dependent oxidoreductase, partial [Acidobacteriota bacterium]
MRTVILGGGLTGLARALRDAQAGHQVTVIERHRIGGLASSHAYDGFIFDTGPHVFRSADPEILQAAKQLLGRYRNAPSKPLIYKYGRAFEFVIPTLPNANIERLPRALREKAKQELELAAPRGSAENFEEAVASRVGTTLYQEFFGDYTEKWWGLPPRHLEAELAPPDLRVGERANYGHLTTGFTHPRQEIYPEEGGIRTLSRNLGAEARRHGAQLMERTEVVDLDIQADRVQQVSVRHADGILKIPAERVVSTIPLVELARLLGLACRLRYRAVVCVFLKVHRPGPLLDASWIYLHDPDVTISRIHEPTYFSPHNAPAGATSLCAEVTCFEDDEVWRDRTLAERVAQELVRLKILPEHAHEIAGVHRVAHAYPVYELGYRDILQRVQTRFSEIDGLETIGRSGTFT